LTVTNLSCRCPYIEIKSASLFLQASDEVLENAVASALDAGYRHFDTARAYENEAALGRALKKWIGGDSNRRKELFIVTKLPPGGE
jgi:alcohol dehydrogenase (NADP+)